MPYPKETEYVITRHGPQPFARAHGMNSTANANLHIHIHTEGELKEVLETGELRTMLRQVLDTIERDWNNK